MINLDHKSGATLHEQIEAEIKSLIIGGVLSPDEQLPSVRELSISLTVNPNTVQRAYKQLEQDGFIYSIKGKGNFVACTTEDDSFRRQGAALAAFSEIVRELKFLGADKEMLIAAINNVYTDKEEIE